MIGKMATAVLDPRWVMRELGIRWKALGPGGREAPKKKKWYALADVDKIRADREMKAYMAKHPEAAERARSPPLSVPAGGTPGGFDGAVSTNVLDLFSTGGGLDPLPGATVGGGGKGFTLMFSDRQIRAASAASAATKRGGAATLTRIDTAEDRRIGGGHDPLACGVEFEETETDDPDQWAAAFDMTIVNGAKAWGDDKVLAGHLKRSEQMGSYALPPCHGGLLDITDFPAPLAVVGSKCPRCSRDTTRCMCFFP